MNSFAGILSILTNLRPKKSETLAPFLAILANLRLKGMNFSDEVWLFSRIEDQKGVSLQLDFWPF